jgi:hypothetical protein
MGITVRGLGVGILAVVVVCLVVSYAELVITYIQIGFLQLPPIAVGLLAIIIFANYYLRKVRQQYGLSAQDIMVIYTMMILAAMVSSRGLVERLLPLLVTPSYFANESNKWRDIFFPNIKQWMVPFDLTKAPPHFEAERFYEGLRVGEQLPWQAWIIPLIAWGVLALFIFGSFLCLAAIMRRQWVDNEKLAFPLVQLPLEMVKEEGSGGVGFFSNRLMWLGFAIPAFIFLINGLHEWFPSVPHFQVYHELSQFFVDRPFNRMGYTPAYISFAVIGFFFLLPVDILFSLWFFFIFTRIENIAMAAYGMEFKPMPMYMASTVTGYQVMGAYFVLAGYFLYVSLPHLKQVLRATFYGSKGDDKNEVLPYRSAVIGLVLCVAGTLLWLNQAGMSFWIAVMEVFIYLFIVAVVMARSTAEGGLLMTETSFRPVDFYRMFAPTHTLGSQNMTVLAFADVSFVKDVRGVMLAGFLDGLRIPDGVGMRRRSFLPVFIVAILLAMIVAGAFQLWLPYDRGGMNMYGYNYNWINWAIFRDYETAMTNDVAYVGWEAPVFFCVGALVTVFLAYMRMMFYWWPLHPLGYALSVSWTVIVFWFPCFVAWTFKSLILRYGGMRLYIQARPFFLGLILGEFIMAIFWTCLAWILDAPAPLFPWP